eukprot:CAMPEP_0185257546 /NCGR_PEP_ID=MMETSP1359-20130426/6605_1 /TAXON_ID=552665 /ORGANISM="Bigelowiella longifila, Strain CCMP242" /LENGTH=78 /DNA_ID=CAMNT_0027842693 /DNA_START=143 /DNA_END=379 /DNA_ORIENTATION=+
MYGSPQHPYIESREIWSEIDSLLADHLVVFIPIFPVKVESFLLRWVLDVRFRQKGLDPEKNLFHGDAWFPAFILIEDA